MMPFLNATWCSSFSMSFSLIRSACSLLAVRTSTFFWAFFSIDAAKTEATSSCARSFPIFPTHLAFIHKAVLLDAVTAFRREGHVDEEDGREPFLQRPPWSRALQFAIVEGLRYQLSRRRVHAIIFLKGILHFPAETLRWKT